MKCLKKILKIIGGTFGLFVILFAGYIVYLYASYHRVPDNQNLKVENRQSMEMKPNEQYKAMTYNIGYGSYPPSYSFFMDGGKQSIADSVSSVHDSINGVVNTTKAIRPDLAFYQEVDVKGNRSRFVNEQKMIANGLDGYSSVFGQNYDSAYLFYPFNQPMGKAKSGLQTESKMDTESVKRYSLPIDTNFNKFMDLDRAFTVSKIPVRNGKQFIAINVHLSAYTKSVKVQNEQLHKLFSLMEQEYKKGNYVMVGGDYNHDVLGDSPVVFGTSKKELTWTKPFPKGKIPNGFMMPTKEVRKNKIPSARSLDESYHPGKTFVTMIDGFIVSKNIETKNEHIQNTKFKYSDHNPVVMDFQLK
ncbi:endonuclease/Exonuclease/phosphatase family protein [Pediococcus claussenii ATCC BAA-344]|uniref:Endonuclease/Exonuclease/phosphatase family protein n=1 Tax=Pediococcus claussenii (strain ATCC BAA-344 / DSM 14800 / JCM 18046 / KCTC 3811 / LMG 21948 / P06) TaxID=701521 RepID=G8PCI3_PEDCP|nr:endonuclease/Exonuclease/phosphatase family protein [Pediococcus claussenii ATCC BAA-344]KRN19230.1 hypothetical protein IV79_GL001602 [Pediococcus claussenii]